MIPVSFSLFLYFSLFLLLLLLFHVIIYFYKNFIIIILFIYFFLKIILFFHVPGFIDGRHVVGNDFERLVHERNETCRNTVFFIIDLKTKRLDSIR